MRTRTRSTVAILSAVFSAFILTTLATPAFAGPGTTILAVADFDQDGTSDFLAEKVGGANLGLLWVIPINQEDSLRKAGASGFPLQLQNGYEFLAVGNFNGNLEGQSQIAARKTSGLPGDTEIGVVKLWDLEPDGKGLTTPLEGVMAFAPDPIYRLIGVGDLDDNGVDDFVFEQANCDAPAVCPNPGLMRAYLMNTSMALQKIAHPLINAGFGAPHEAFGVADANGDGFADIVLARRDADPATRPNANGNLRTFLMQGDGVDSISVSGQAFAFDLPGPEYNFVGFAGAPRLLLLFEKTSGTNAGLIQARIVEDTSASALSLPFYVVNLGNTSLSYIGNGLFDGDINTDFAFINNTSGIVHTVLLEAFSTRDVDMFKSRVFPVDLTNGAEVWANRATGAVTFP
jgi:hypothetical protein